MRSVDNQSGQSLNSAALARAARGAPAGAPLTLAGFVPFPSTSTKFVVRWSEAAGRYYSLTNPAAAPAGYPLPGHMQRNALVLAATNGSDLSSWAVCGEGPVLWDDTGYDWNTSVAMTGFQYADWRFDGGDIVAAVRAGYRGSHTLHDASRLLFTRVEGYAGWACGRGDPRAWPRLLQPDPLRRGKFGGP